MPKKVDVCEHGFRAMCFGGFGGVAEGNGVGKKVDLY